VRRHRAGSVHRPARRLRRCSETYCTVGFPATDAQGNKHFLTAGHCTNDANQPAYGEISQRNRLGTSNVGGVRSVNAREGDMGVVAVTETGWTISPVINTWGQSALTVTGSAEAIVGDLVCHSGNTAPNFECGRVTAVNQSIDYGNVVVDGLTTTTACSQGGDSGGARLRGDRAVGLHSGGNSTCTPNDDNSIFQSVNEALAKWNLTLLTGDPGDPDEEAPATLGNVRSTGTTSSSVSLAWDASTDNTGVTGYDVYNGNSLAGRRHLRHCHRADRRHGVLVHSAGQRRRGQQVAAERGSDGQDPAGQHRRPDLQQQQPEDQRKPLLVGL
jgi:streptogrisin C